MMFLDPNKTISTCGSDSCADCEINRCIHCHFRLKDWVHFLLISLPPFLIAGAEIYAANAWWLILWLAFIVAFFGFIEIRVMCSHCPHYAEAPSSLKCWANYGSFKLWQYRPGPMTAIEKIIFFSGFVIVWGYPLPILFSGRHFFLLIVYGMTTGGFFLTLTRLMCCRCMNFACPLNRVDEQVRDQFFEKNPSVANAWKNE